MQPRGAPAVLEIGKRLSRGENVYNSGTTRLWGTGDAVMKQNWFLRHRLLGFLLIAVVPAILAYLLIDARCAAVWFFVFAVLLAYSTLRSPHRR